MQPAQHHDVIVLGLGAMGAATAYQLARRGARVAGFDQYHPPHQQGSSHGDTRITRLAVGEGSEYVPIVKRSHELWAEIGSEAETTIIENVGGLILGEAGNDFFEQTIRSAAEYAVPIEILDPLRLHKEFPMFSGTAETLAIYEPSAGFVRPERAIQAQLELAAELGAKLHFNARIEKVETTGERAAVFSSDGSIDTADQIVIAAGPWVSQMLPKLAVEVHLQALHWFPIRKGYAELAQMPIFIWEFSHQLGDFVYGFPAIDGPGGGVKVATETYAAARNIQDGKPEPGPELAAAIFREYVKPNLPWLGSEPLRSLFCFYTVSADHRFIIDQLDSDIWLISACSGHGFKHSPAIGEAVAERILTGRSSLDLSSFALDSKIL